MPRVELLPIERLSDREFEELVRAQTFFYDKEITDYRNAPSEQKRSTEEAVREWLVQQRRLASKGAWRIIAARVGNRIAGYTVINVSPQDKSIRMHEAFVWPEFRSPELRIGDRFLVKALEIGKSLGYTRLWKVNVHTTPKTPGVRKAIERITSQPLGEWPKDYPKPLNRTRSVSRVYYTKEGVMGLAASPNWSRSRGIPDYSTFKGFSKYPHFTMQISNAAIKAARQRVRIKRKAEKTVSPKRTGQLWRRARVR